MTDIMGKYCGWQLEDVFNSFLGWNWILFMLAVSGMKNKNDFELKFAHFMGHEFRIWASDSQ